MNLLHDIKSDRRGKNRGQRERAGCLWMKMTALAPRALTPLTLVHTPRGRADVDGWAGGHC